MVNAVKHVGEIDEAWLTAALRETGRLESEVTRVASEGVGQGVGLMAELARLTIEYAGVEDLPSSMIAKFATRNDNRAVAQLLDFYNRETNFYNKIGHRGCPFRVPESYFGKVEQDTYDFVLLMEDLGDVAPNDQITGSSAEEALEKIDNIAKLHAMFWNRVREPQNAWMYDFVSVAERQKLRDYVYGPAVEPAIEKFSSHFTAEQKEICRKVGQRYVELLEPLSESETFLHGDYRQDNFIYRKDNNEAVVMDWQISGMGPGVFDVTYFICQSLQTDVRHELQRELLKRYVARLRENGVSGYDFEQAWNDYRLLILFCLIYPITVCGTLDTANERGRALAECMLDRNLSAVDDLDCNEFLD